MIFTRCRHYLEDIQRQVFRGLVVRVFFIFQVVPDLPRLACVHMRMQIDFEWCTLGGALFLECKKAIEEEQEVIQVTCDVKSCPPLDEADVLGILLTKSHRHS